MMEPTYTPGVDRRFSQAQPSYYLPALPYSPTAAAFSNVSMEKEDPAAVQSARVSARLSRQTHIQEAPPAETPQGKHHVLRFWLWEISALVSALFLVAATVSVPAYYSGKRMPQLPFSISLNTLVTLLAVLLRAAISVAVASVINQAKWSWFEKPRPLSHLSEFDWASRSVVGSARLLYIAPTSLWGGIGAILTIVSLGIAPLAQQAVKTVACHHTTRGNAFIPASHFMPGRSPSHWIGTGLEELQVDMKGAMINALANPTGGNDTSVSASCQTGNCNFPVSSEHVTHSSIGMCSACMDTTFFVRSSVRGNYTLPNGLYINPGTSGTHLSVVTDSNFTWVVPKLPDDFTALARGALANVTILAVTQAQCDKTDGSCLNNPNEKVDYVSTSCALYPCLKNYHAKVKGGVLDEIVISTQPTVVSGGISLSSANEKGNHTALKMPCTVDGQEYDLGNISTVSQRPSRQFTLVSINNTNIAAPEECLYKLSWLYGSAINRFMTSTLFSGHCTYDMEQGDFLYCGNAWWLAPLYNSKLASFDSISRAMDQFTTALTDKFRTTGGSNYDAAEQEVVVGNVVEVAVCTVLDGRWLVIPVGLLFLTILYWIFMVLKNYSEPWLPVWKDSLLPLLYYGLGPHRPPQIEREPRVLDLAQVDRTAEKRLAKFFSNGAEAGWVDEGETAPSETPWTYASG